MRLIRHGSFDGGIDLPEEKHATLESPIRPAGSVRSVSVPLTWTDSPAAEPIVEHGRRVERHEVIATASEPGGLNVLAPAAGTVDRIVTVAVATARGWRRVPALHLTDIEPPPPPHHREPAGSATESSNVEQLEHLAHGTLTTGALPVEPLARWIRRASARKCRLIIANATEPQPYVTATHRMLVEYPSQVLSGLALLGRAIGASEVVLAADRRRAEAYGGLLGPADLCKVQLVAVGQKYPTGATNVLIKVLTGKEVPPGRDPSRIGIAVIDPAGCLWAYRWATLAEPPSGRVVTVSGPAAPRPGNYFVPFGTSWRDLLRPLETPVIHGGPMNGLACPPDAVVGPGTDALLALDGTPQVAATPCIRCSWCTDHCPARLNVAVLNDMYELGLWDRAQRLVPEACVECGICSYVCPARLPLSDRVRQLKIAAAGRRRQMPLFSDSG